MEIRVPVETKIPSELVCHKFHVKWTFHYIYIDIVIIRRCVAPGFKNKTRYTPYVSPGSQISHIATIKVIPNDNA
jgi:hypothetical protein